MTRVSAFHILYCKLPWENAWRIARMALNDHGYGLSIDAFTIKKNIHSKWPQSVDFFPIRFDIFSHNVCPTKPEYMGSMDCCVVHYGCANMLCKSMWQIKNCPFENTCWLHTLIDRTNWQIYYMCGHVVYFCGCEFHLETAG